jgi:hypothetical protein
MTAPGTGRTGTPPDRTRIAADATRRPLSPGSTARTAPATTGRPSARLDLRMPAVVALCAAGYAVSIAAVVHLQTVRDPAFTNPGGSPAGAVAVAAAAQPQAATAPPAPPAPVVGSDTPTSTQALANDITALETQAQSVAAQALTVAGPGSLGGSQFSIGAPRTHGTTGGSGQN